MSCTQYLFQLIDFVCLTDTVLICVVGNYLYASAYMGASTHDESLKKKMTSVFSALSSCQDLMGTGYLLAFPAEFFGRFEAIKPISAPDYTIHKILAGLLDQYNMSGNDQAFKMVKWMVENFYNRVQNVVSRQTIERHWTSMNETGGMNDVLYRLYSITVWNYNITEIVNFLN